MQSIFVRVSNYAHFKLHFAESYKQDLGKWRRYISFIVIVSPPPPPPPPPPSPRDWSQVSWGGSMGGEWKAKEKL